MKKNIIAGITIGDPNGIGPEIIIKTFSDPKLLSTITPVIYSPIDVLDFYLKKLNVDLAFNRINSPKHAVLGKINVLLLDSFEFIVEPGKVTKNAGEISFISLKNATEDLFNNLTDFIVTAPINKDNIQNKEFTFFGHTEYFTKKCSLKESLMLMVHGGLRVGLVTNHLPVKDVSKAITKEKILTKLILMNNSIKSDFGITNPKIAVLGLNPHSGDNGLIGLEEKEIIIPAIKKALNKNINVSGPFPADGFFANNNHKNYDAVLGMYHDQGLIPFKVLSKNEGVNFTAGLPIIRTSPDHGTGYDIAGKGIANSTSFENAIIMAKDIFDSRKILI